MHKVEPHMLTLVIGLDSFVIILMGASVMIFHGHVSISQIFAINLDVFIQ